jgi:uncharacterized protein
MGARLDAGREVAVAFFAVAAITAIVSWTPFELLTAYGHLILAGLFLTVAVRMSERQPDGLIRYGISLGGLLERSERPRSGIWGAICDLGAALARALPSGLRELAVALAIALIVFPAFALGFYLWHAPAQPFHLEFPAELPSYLLAQLLVVALPEEALFRGYMQGRLSDAFPARMRLFGARLSLPAWLIQALLFASLHVVTNLHPSRLAVFFPGLLFGLIRELRGGIGAALVFHALCNLFADVLARSWF